MIEYTLISSNEDLKNQCKYLETQEQIAIDLEADSMHHFKERVCLIQVADPKRHYLIDPLTISDFSPLKPICGNPATTKIFHGADFDIRSLDRDFGIKINNLFDSEIACRFLGIQKRSLAALLKKHFNLNLDKRFQKTDWSQRPLSKQMIEYSINDVAYLIELAQILKKKLIDAGRLEWAEEEFKLQTEVRYDAHEDMPLFMKFKGAGKMGRESLAILESLLQMRVQIAKERNLPLFKIISAESITAMTLRKPQTMNELKQSNALSPKQITMYGDRCIKAILKGISISKDKMPSYPKKQLPESQLKAPEKISALKNLREVVSQKTGIEPGFLMSNATIAAVSVANPSSVEELLSINGTRRWQVELLGKDVLKILNE